MAIRFLGNKRCPCGELLILPGTRMKKLCWKCVKTKHAARRKLSKERKKNENHSLPG